MALDHISEEQQEQAGITPLEEQDPIWVLPCPVVLVVHPLRRLLWPLPLLRVLLVLLVDKVAMRKTRIGLLLPPPRGICTTHPIIILVR